MLTFDEFWPRLKAEFSKAPSRKSGVYLLSIPKWSQFRGPMHGEFTLVYRGGDTIWCDTASTDSWRSGISPVHDVRDALPEVFGRRPLWEKGQVLGMDYVGGRRCKTYVYRERRGEHRGRLKLSSGEYEATRGDVERLLRAASDLLGRRRGRHRRPTGA